MRPAPAVVANSIRIATWNVNSINARIEVVTDWLKVSHPQVLLMQEMKCTDEELPRAKSARLSYNVETVGQRSYNGVAIASQFLLSVEPR